MDHGQNGRRKATQWRKGSDCQATHHATATVGTRICMLVQMIVSPSWIFQDHATIFFSFFLFFFFCSFLFFFLSRMRISVSTCTEDSDHESFVHNTDICAVSLVTADITNEDQRRSGCDLSLSATCIQTQSRRCWISRAGLLPTSNCADLRAICTNLLSVTQDSFQCRCSNMQDDWESKAISLSDGILGSPMM